MPYYQQTNAFIYIICHYLQFAAFNANGIYSFNLILCYVIFRYIVFYVVCHWQFLVNVVELCALVLTVLCFVTAAWVAHSLFITVLVWLVMCMFLFDV